MVVVVVLVLVLVLVLILVLVLVLLRRLLLLLLQVLLLTFALLLFMVTCFYKLSCHVGFSRRSRNPTRISSPHVMHVMSACADTSYNKRSRGHHCHLRARQREGVGGGEERPAVDVGVGAKHIADAGSIGASATPRL